MASHRTKEIAFWVIGILTFVYCVAELGIALYFGSLTLLSDGFHNLSDVLSLAIAFWASKASRRGSSDKMSYGWARTEILGALTNGVFLLSLCLYTSLQAVPEILQTIDQVIKNTADSTDAAGYYFIAVAAAGLLVNTIVTVVFALTGNAHGHSHAGGGGHGHSHGGGHGHSHGTNDHEENDHEESNHSHSHGSNEDISLLAEDNHSHSHGHGKQKKKKDMNVQAVFLHYLGDMISSFFVLIAGILMTVFDSHDWVLFIDPVTSLVICGLILFTTLPLVRGCLHILLQSTPKNLDLNKIKSKIKGIAGVLSLHDFHAWQLTDGMIITSLHVVCGDPDTFPDIAKDIKQILHKYGIHSTAIQPEFVDPNENDVVDHCKENCVEDCKEDWCCKEPEKPKSKRRSGSSYKSLDYGIN